MRILHTSDWHLGSTPHGFDRTDELFQQVEHVLRIAEEKNVDVLLVVGDIFERQKRERLHDVTKRLAQLLKPRIEAGLRVILVPGNHDYRDHFRMMRSLLELEHGVAERVRIVQSVDEFVVDGVQFVIIPYPERELLETYGQDQNAAHKVEASERNQSLSVILADLVRDVTARIDPSRPSVFATHIQVEGIITPSEKELTYREDLSLSRQSLPTDVSYIALGHIHQTQQIPHVAPCWYSGSFDRMDLGERDDEKCVLLVEVNGSGAAIVTPLPIAATPFADLHLSSTELEDVAVNYAERERAYVRLNLSCVTGDDPIALRRHVKDIFPRCLDVNLSGVNLASPITKAPANPKDYMTTVIDYLDESYADDPDLPALKTCAQALIQEVNDALTAH